MVATTAIRMARLLRWLGPQTPPTAVPPNVQRREVTIERADADLSAVTFAPVASRQVYGSLLLVPGLHFLGSDDPRFDRFARVLADSGLFVLSPNLPDYRNLRITTRVVEDTEAAFDALTAMQPEFVPSVLSISFGSMPALKLAAKRPEEVKRLVVFGGFYDFRRTLRFSLQGNETHRHDPLNAPVSFINLLDHMEPLPDTDRAELRRAFHQQCVRTWGKPEAKDPGFYISVAKDLASELPPHLRDLFLCGARASEGTVERALHALEGSGTAFDWIDVEPHLGSIRARVDLVHGTSDDVIPFRESVDLLAALPPDIGARLHLTGLYGHTATATMGELFSRASELGREAVSTFRILHALATL